jgi:predicted ATPase/class 3 adenylate cyclase
VSDLPSGTVTFLFTDLERSTRLWEEDPKAMRTAMARHDALLEDAITRHGGVVFSHRGDGMAAAFGSAPQAVAAAVDGQLALSDEVWDAPGPLQARMGLHAGEGALVGDQYGSQQLNRCARLMAVAHGGQVVVSDAVEALVRGELPPGVGLLDLGEYRLRDLSHPMHVFQVTHPGLAGGFPALRSLDAFPGNLPVQLSSFIGREREIAGTIDALDTARLVTVTGVGGVGKTRLALQVAAEALPRFREGAWLVELGSVRDPDGVLDAFAGLFGVTARAGETLQQALVEFLRAKQLLLVVDNCEHLLEAVADLLDVIERSCAGVVVLATSREGLALEGEQILAVPSLHAPGDNTDLDAIARADAVRLFVERAHAADADFSLDAANAAAVAQVCRRLDGVPLAIELAAARVTAMSPAELAMALDRRFEVLAGGRRRAVKRHQTLRATIDWSYDLLDEPHRRLLARLSVFAGGCTRDAAQAVCAGEPVQAAAVFELLADLVARSLVVADRSGPETRYRLLETIREYGEERLAEYGETMVRRDRHARYFVERGRTITEGLLGPDQIVWGNRHLAEHENFQAAMAHALDTQDLDLAVGLLVNAAFAFQVVRYVLRLPADPVLALPGAREHPGFPVALMRAASEAVERGELALAEELVQHAIDGERALGVPAPSIVPLDVLADNVRVRVATATSSWPVVVRVSLESAQRCRAYGLSSIAASNLVGAANALSLAGDRDAAVPIATEGLELARAVGMPTVIVSNLYALAQALADRDPDRARALLQEALDLNASLGYQQTYELVGMTLVAARLADWCFTARLAGPTIRHLHWMGERPMLTGIFNVSARALADSDPEAAAVIQGAARTLALAVTTGSPKHGAASGTDTRADFFVETRRETTRRLIDRLGDDRRHELQARGAAMDGDDAVAFALAHLDMLLAHAEQQ